MTDLAGVVRCPLRMQRCERGEDACPYSPLRMGLDPEDVVDSVLNCAWAGADLPAYHYRGLVARERKRFASELAGKAWEGAA